jgi:hypothetical protein
MAKTRQMIREKVMLELDLMSQSGSYVKGISFIKPTEIDDHIRDSIKLIASYIHNLYEDYYFTIANLSLVSGVSDYNLPTDIYVNKLRRIIYNNGSTKYKVSRITNIDDIPYINDGDYYKYQLTNNGLVERLKLYPAAHETAANVIQIYYYRRPKDLLLDTDVLDIPEDFDNVVIEDVKYRCLSKEPENPMLSVVKASRDEHLSQMIATLSKRVPDDQTDIRPDISFYEDSIA